ncbi:type II secretion system protein GspD [Wenyingzhuangia sp. IMCC45533]
MRIYITICIFLIKIALFAQNDRSNNRLDILEQKLNTLAIEKEGLLKTVNFNVKNTKLPDFVNAVANLHQVDIGIDTSLNSISLSNNFSDAKVKDILLYLCKEYNLTLNFTGNIIALKKYIAPRKKYIAKNLKIDFSQNDRALSFELKKDTLFQVFKKISQLTSKNLVFAPGMENIKLTGYINKLPVDDALDKLAFTNDLILKKTTNNHYIFERNDIEYEDTSDNRNNRNNRKRPSRKKYQNNQFYYKVKDTVKQLLDVEFTNTNISEIIETIGYDLQINSFTTAPLESAGKATVNAKNIFFDDLLKYILEDSQFSYKKENNFYFFGENKQKQIHKSVAIPLRHRSIQVFSDSGESSFRNSLNNNGSSFNNGGFNNNLNDFNNGSNNFNSNGINNNNFNSNGNNRNTSTNFETPRSSGSSASVQNFQDLIPSQYTDGLEVKVDSELNSFIVEGPAIKVNKFEKFVEYIDKPVPIVLIEVMIIETNKSLNIDTGIDFGVRDTPTQLNGQAFPDTNLNLGANEINRIIGGFDAFGIKNIGRVVPNFYASIRAMESNGVIKVKSTPKLATLNSHSARLSIGETTYYAVTQTNIIGTQNPQTSEITNFYPIDAQLGINLTPLVSGDGSITLNINVIQSNFNGTRISEEAPPGINSREFSSAIRVFNNDMIILGGLEEKRDNDSNTGVPILSRIPILKYLFSSKRKEDVTRKLSILIKPTIIQ